MSASEKAQPWIRQILGNTGSVGYEEAMSGLAIVEQNLKAGLFPTTGGAVSLMAKGDVDVIFSGNRGLFAKFRPQILDNPGTRAKSLDDWRIAALEQALFHRKGQNAPFDIRFTRAMDGFLHGYQSSGVDWARIHAYAIKLHGAMPPIWQTPYWYTNIHEPLTVLAFCDVATRASAPKPY